VSEIDRKRMLDALRIAYGHAATEVVLIALQNVFGDMGWIAAGASPEAEGWFVRCHGGSVLATNASSAAIPRIITQLEAVLSHPEYDQELSVLDGYFLDVLIVRDGKETSFEASTADVDVRLMDWIDKLFDLPRGELTEVFNARNG
jgi:hypothetical protein